MRTVSSRANKSRSPVQSFAAAVAWSQVLTLVHVSAQRKRILWHRGEFRGH